MRVLGISGGFGHDAAVAVVDDGVVGILLEEERLTRLKGAPQALPLRALDFVLASGPVASQDVDAVVASWDPGLDTSTPGLALMFEGLAVALERHGIDRGRLRAVPHHAAHAVAAATFGDPRGCAAVIVADGRGETASTSVYLVDDCTPTLVAASPIASSLGHFYAAATEVCGFGPGAQGKTTGLAPFGRPRWALDLHHVQNMRVTLGDLPGVGDAPNASARRAWAAHLRKLVGGHRQRSLGIDRVLRPNVLPGFDAWAADLAASAQRQLERVLCDLVAEVMATHPGLPVFLAGGVALNCSSNRLLRDRGLRVRLVPVPHDAGSAIGAALLVAHEMGCTVAPLGSPYLGLGWPDAELRSYLAEVGVGFDRPADVAEAAAALLREGLVVGWFQGRAEVGPRALGHRSILARADRPPVRDRVNRNVKRREPWRPFGPSVSQDDAHRLLDISMAPYMIETAHVADPAALAGVTHVDGTTRPHVVDPELGTAPAFVRLLGALHVEIGTAAVLNTSFNVGREPIVCSPPDALATFFTSALDALVLGPFLLRKDRP